MVNKHHTDDNKQTDKHHYGTPTKTTRALWSCLSAGSVEAGCGWVRQAGVVSEAGVDRVEGVGVGVCVRPDEAGRLGMEQLVRYTCG